MPFLDGPTSITCPTRKVKFLHNLTRNRERGGEREREREMEREREREARVI